MCSNRWAKPVRPGFSLAGPTWYQRFTATSGSRWSSTRITSSPFFSLYLSNWMWGAVLLVVVLAATGLAALAVWAGAGVAGSSAMASAAANRPVVLDFGI